MTASSVPTLAPHRASFPERVTLTVGDRIVVRAIAEAMFSEDGDVEQERLDAHVTEVDAFISSASRPLRSGLRVALFVVRIAPVLFFFRLRTLERLSVADRVTVLSRLERSRIAHLSLAFIGWRTVMTFVFYEHPVELAAIGYATEERKVYKRRLALVPLVAPASLIAVAPPASPPPQHPAQLAPPAAESGVRLRDVDSDDSPAAAVRAANDTEKVA